MPDDEPLTYTVRVTNTAPDAAAHLELSVDAQHRPTGVTGRWMNPWVLAPGESVSLDIPEGLLITLTKD